MMTGIRVSSVLGIVLLGLAGCGGQPMAFPVPDSEMGPAPGLLTGPTGSYELPIVKSRPPDPDSGPAPAGAPK
jgi:hypothetical protein